MLGLAAGTPAARLADCRVAGLAHEVRCGSVRRPLDPQQPAGVQIDVAYVVVPALARRKRPDPVFVLAGGPGQSAIAIAPQVMPLLARLNNRRDIVFVDQRGTGRSAPLECDDASREPLSDQTDPERQLARLAQCRAELERLPHVAGPSGLRFYTTTIAMQDLDAVRRALGVERIDLVGASYGTRAALEYLRQFPRGGAAHGPRRRGAAGHGVAGELFHRRPGRARRRVRGLRRASRRARALIRPCATTGGRCWRACRRRSASPIR